MNPTTSSYDLEMFFNGTCPICSREVSLLQRLDRHERLRFVDISAPHFDAASTGVGHEELMATIHGRLSDGTMVEGVDVFRHAYRAVDFSSLIELTGLPGVEHLLDASHRLFAKHRLRFAELFRRDRALDPTDRRAWSSINS